MRLVALLLIGILFIHSEGGAGLPATDSTAAPRQWPTTWQQPLPAHITLADTARLWARARPTQPLRVSGPALHQLSALYLSAAYQRPDRLRRALKPLLTGLQQAQARRDTTWLLDFNFALGQHLLQNAGQASPAMTYLLAGRQLAEARHDTARLSQLALQLAFCHNRLRQPQGTIAYCRELLRYAEPTGDLDGQSHAYSTIADAYGQLENYPAVLHHAKIALALARRAGNRVLVGTYFGNLVQPNYHLGRYAEAARLLDSAYLLRDPRLDPLGHYYLHCNKAEMLLLQGRFAEALPLTELALRYARQVSAHELQHFALDLQVPILTGLKRYREALTMQQSLARLNDSTFQAQAHERAETMRTLYETEKQQAQLGRQRQRINGLASAARLREADLRRRTTLLWAAVVTAALLIALAALLFNRNRLRQRANRLLSEQKNELAVAAGQLQALNATKDRLFALVAHDLRNPLAALTGIQALIQRYVRRGEPERLVELGDHLHQTAQGLYGVLDNVLGWAISQSGNLEPRPEPVDVPALLREAAALGQLQATAQEIELRVEAAPGLTLTTDRQMLRTLLRNLLGNALKFTPTGGRVTLLADALADQQLRFRFVDTGPGFSAAAARAWQAAEVAPRTTDASGRTGQGLGLVVCRAFVGQLGGELGWHNRPEGGAEVTLLLPQRQAAAVER